MLSNTGVNSTQIAMTQYIVASLSPSVISQRPIYRSLPIYQNSWSRFKSKSFSKISSAFAYKNGSSAEIDFIHAVLEAINYFVFLNSKYYLNTKKLF